MTDKVKRGLGDNSKNNSDYISMYEKNAVKEMMTEMKKLAKDCLLYTSPSPRDLSTSRMPSSA